MTVEWRRDVEPILQARCASCHGAASPAGGLPLARATAPVPRDGVSWPGAYYRLVLDAVSLGRVTLPRNAWVVRPYVDVEDVAAGGEVGGHGENSQGIKESFGHPR